MKDVQNSAIILLLAAVLHYGDDFSFVVAYYDVVVSVYGNTAWHSGPVIKMLIGSEGDNLRKEVLIVMLHLPRVGLRMIEENGMIPKCYLSLPFIVIVHADAFVSIDMREKRLLQKGEIN